MATRLHCGCPAGGYRTTCHRADHRHNAGIVDRYADRTPVQLRNAITLQEMAIRWAVRDGDAHAEHVHRTTHADLQLALVAR